MPRVRSLGRESGLHCLLCCQRRLVGRSNLGRTEKPLCLSNALFLSRRSSARSNLASYPWISIRCSCMGNYLTYSISILKHYAGCSWRVSVQRRSTASALNKMEKRHGPDLNRRSLTGQDFCGIVGNLMDESAHSNPAQYRVMRPWH